jgi:hypothetical protein
MKSETETAAELRDHQRLCGELLALSEAESRALGESENHGSFALHQARKQLLPRLKESVGRLKLRREERERRGPGDRAWSEDVARLLRESQELTMRILMLDRENEQALLRRGMIPASHLPPAPRQRPHFVAELYRRHAG